MERKLKFYIVDDDSITLKLMAKLMSAEDREIITNTSSIAALTDIVEQKPDCVISDLMMPEMDGLELLKKLKSEPELASTKFIIVSGKAYEFDRKRAMEFGADAYFVKPVDQERFIPQLLSIIEDKITLSFWGVHGTLAIPGEQTVIYGGNTSCVTLQFPRGQFFIFDAGTGIKALSDHLLANQRRMIGTKIFISHPHWDHINGLPFFVPLYIQGNEFEICGPSHGDITMKDLISGQMDGVYFPVNIKEFSASVHFKDLKEEGLDINGIAVKTMLLNHPGYCLGYRVTYKNRSICYVTDNELYPKSSPYYNEHYINQLSDFIKNADALITDCTYTRESYAGHEGWGHSATEDVAELAHQSGVKTLYLYHHDPDQTDTDIDGKLALAREVLDANGSSTRLVAPKEKERFKI